MKKFFLLALFLSSTSLVEANVPQRQPYATTYYRNGTVKDNPPVCPNDTYRYYRVANKNNEGRPEVAYMDERDRDIHQRAERMGNWDERANWRYNREAFFSGENQPDAYNHIDINGTGGIGRYSDRDTTEVMQKHYRSQDNGGTRPSAL